MNGTGMAKHTPTPARKSYLRDRAAAWASHARVDAAELQEDGGLVIGQVLAQCGEVVELVALPHGMFPGVRTRGAVVLSQNGEHRQLGRAAGV